MESLGKRTPEPVTSDLKFAKETDPDSRTGEQNGDGTASKEVEDFHTGALRIRRGYL